MVSLLRRLRTRVKQRRARAAAALAQRASSLRQQARTAGPLSAAELRELASLEDVYLGPGRSRSARFQGDDLELGEGLVARLGRPDGDYWFLGRGGTGRSTCAGRTRWGAPAAWSPCPPATPACPPASTPWPRCIGSCVMEGERGGEDEDEGKW
ncbi:hypothetical protein F4775DRAFT_602979 [Biscogniauxia sp. FL1348]|nr:hypothetical protein F4775DRAFT_602979 [Biscogniauxia sp. FL1348]